MITSAPTSAGTVPAWQLGVSAALVGVEATTVGFRFVGELAPAFAQSPLTLLLALTGFALAVVANAGVDSHMSRRTHRIVAHASIVRAVALIATVAVLSAADPSGSAVANAAVASVAAAAGATLTWHITRPGRAKAVPATEAHVTT